MAEQQRQLCVTCRRSVLRDRNRHLLTREYMELRQGFTNYVLERIHAQEMAQNETQNMCHRCWVAANRSQARFEQENHPEEEAAPVAPLNPTSVPSYRRVANTSRHCLFHGCHINEFYRVPSHLKVYLLVEHSVYVPSSARICGTHMNSNNWSVLYENGEMIFTPDQLKDIMDILREAYRTKSMLDFDNIISISPEELYFHTGVTHEQFEIILSETPSLTQQSKRPKTALSAYLLKLRSGEPNSRIAYLLGMSKRTLSRHLKTARECLTQDFVLKHLGFDHITRQEIIAHSLTVPTEIFGNPRNPVAIIQFDGTYIYIQKSMNFLFQKKTYSLHKYKNLLKPFLIVCPDGYIIDITGPHAATTSDALIMSDIMKNLEAPIHYVLHQNDVFILDRGFRDSLGDIESCGYKPHMPPSKDRHTTQLTDVQANKSRLITIVRWSIEVINGWFKRDFKLFRNTLFNKSMPHAFEDFRIAGALLNAFRPRLVDSPHSNAFLQILGERMNTPNRLGTYVVAENVNRQRTAFNYINDINNNVLFPRLTEDDVVLFSLGTYHLNLAKSYVAEHLRGGDGVYTIEVSLSPCPDMSQYDIDTENCVLLRGRILSRHISNKIYYTYILINQNAQERNDIKEYYCTCMTGMRTLGACAHTISIIWYLGVCRHFLNEFVGPASAWDNIIIESPNTI